MIYRVSNRSVNYKLSNPLVLISGFALGHRPSSAGIYKAKAAADPIAALGAKDRSDQACAGPCPRRCWCNSKATTKPIAGGTCSCTKIILQPGLNNRSNLPRCPATKPCCAVRDNGGFKINAPAQPTQGQQRAGQPGAVHPWGAHAKGQDCCRSTQPCWSLPRRYSGRPGAQKIRT